MSEIKLSIIVPVYNAEKHIFRCIESLLNQNLGTDEYEIILVNDGSKDNSFSLCKSYAERHSAIKFYSHKNMGVSATRNFGLSLAQGTYVYFMDSDDYIAHESLNKILTFSLENDLDIIGFNFIRTNKKNLTQPQPLNIDKAFEEVKIFDGPKYLEDQFFYSSSWWFILKRNILVEHNLKFREDLFALEDVIFTTTVILSAKRIAFIDKNIYRYFRTKNSMLTNNEENHYLKIIYSMSSAIKTLGEIIDTYHDKHKNKKTTYRLKSRQESLLFFLIIRAFKSTISLKKLLLILDEMKTIKVYPMNNFIRKDFNNAVYRTLCAIFNNYNLLNISFKVFRFIKPGLQYIMPKFKLNKYST